MKVPKIIIINNTIKFLKKIIIFSFIKKIEKGGRPSKMINEKIWVDVSKFFVFLSITFSIFLFLKDVNSTALVIK